MSTLRPTTIVDKNGKTTTVHRKDALNAPTAKSLPAPQLASQAGTPLPTIVPATRSETRKLDNELVNGPEYWPMDLSIITKELSKRDHALVRRMLDNPGINNEILLGCVQYGVRDETITPDEVTAALLILEKMYALGDGHLLERSGPYSFYQSVLGAYQESTRFYIDKVTPIVTEEELASKTAFVTFVLLAEENHQHDDTILRRGMKQFNHKWKREFLTTQNKHLKALILDRPAQQQEITDYVRLRGMHTVNKGPVNALRSYLDETIKVQAVGSGWL